VHIFIVGINHQIQPVDIRSWGSGGEPQEFERQRKEHFAGFVQESITAKAIQIIAEETKHGEESITQRVCASAKCRYANIEMTPDERKARGIPPGYNENSNTPANDRERWNQEREESMATKLISEAGSAERVMVVCGRMHVQALAGRFANGGHTVETDDLQNQPWYIEDWFWHMMHL